MTTKRKLLFVDDDINILEVFRMQLLSMNDVWDMEFVSSGKAALEALDRETFDVLITDMRMPGMDGAQLLKETQHRHSNLVRLVLSGADDRESVLRCVGVTHQFLIKPFDVALLRAKVSGALALRDLIQDETLRTLLSQVQSIPSLPAAYKGITEELRSNEPSINKVGSIIARDIGMTAKVLQLVNSAFFGLSGRVSNPEQAVRIVGLQTISSLVLMISVFSQVTSKKTSGFDVGRVWQHCLSTGQLSREIARRDCQDRVTIDDAYTAGLLHGIGTLALADLRPDYAEILQSAQSEGVPVWEKEKAVIGATSSQAGAYLMSLWGLPHSVIEAVAWHKCPSLCPNPEFSPLTTVHIADVLLSQTGNEPQLDVPYLEQMWPDGALPAKIAAWKELLRVHVNVSM